MIKTEIGYTTPDKIVVRGYNLAEELIGKIDFVDMILLVTHGRRCSDAEKDMINTILVTVTDHGLTPSAVAARLTYTGAPESLQGAVAAGLLGAGSVFLGWMENAANMLREGAAALGNESTDEEVRAAAESLVDARRAARQPLAGVGHNIHVEGDPRIPSLREVSVRNGFHGIHWRLLTAIGEATATRYRRPLHPNTAGAVGAMVADMGLPSSMARGLALVGRCAGLVAHIIEEEQSPTGQELWNLVLRQDPRNVLPPNAR